MAISESFKDFILDQLVFLGDVTVKKMFGGAGLYFEGCIFALIAKDILYFKVTDSNKLEYELAGMEPFKPFEDKSNVMPYYEVPVEVLENRERLAEWARKALIASINTSSKKKKNNKFEVQSTS